MTCKTPPKNSKSHLLFFPLSFLKLYCWFFGGWGFVAGVLLRGFTSQNKLLSKGRSAKKTSGRLFYCEWGNENWGCTAEPPTLKVQPVRAVGLNKLVCLKDAPLPPICRCKGHINAYDHSEGLGELEATIDILPSTLHMHPKPYLGLFSFWGLDPPVVCLERTTGYFYAPATGNNLPALRDHPLYCARHMFVQAMTVANYWVGSEGFIRFNYRCCLAFYPGTQEYIPFLTDRDRSFQVMP
jgi:hypothetical protein